jgi:hypothetical protein
MFQKRHFEFLAAALRRARGFGPVDDGCYRAMIGHLVIDLAGTNPKFDRERFLKACGL